MSSGLSRLRKLGIPVGVVFLLIAVGARLRSSSSRELGEQLYHGRIPLTARLVGHEDPLPPEVVRCVNCHGLESKTDVQSGSPSSQSSSPFSPRPAETLGPALGPISLTTDTKRRGGPPSRYTRATLCRVLRDGVDPAHVMIPQTMPRYTVSDAECRALWDYLAFL